MREIEAAELLAIDLFRRAKGVPVTDRMIRTRCSDMSRPARSGHNCTAAAKARASHVLLVVSAWQRAARRAGR